MKTIEIEDDIYSALSERVMKSNHTLMDVLRENLGIEVPKVIQTRNHDVVSRVGDQPLLSFVMSPAYTFQTSGIGKYLSVLTWLNKNAPEKFLLIERYRRGKRTYFSKDPNKIKESGKGLTIKRIPETDFYALATMDHATKRRVIYELLLIMGYSKATVGKVAETIEDSGITRTRSIDISKEYQ